MCMGCLPKITPGLSELEKVRRQASAYANTFLVDVVVVKTEAGTAFYPEQFKPENSEIVEFMTPFYHL